MTNRSWQQYVYSTHVVFSFFELTNTVVYVERKGIFLHSDFKEKNERIIIFKISERESEKRKRREKCTLKRNLRFLRIFMQPHVNISQEMSNKQTFAGRGRKTESGKTKPEKIKSWKTKSGIQELWPRPWVLAVIRPSPVRPSPRRPSPGRLSPGRPSPGSRNTGRAHEY